LNESIDLNCSRFNKNLTSWLIEYNFNRPHQSLNYLTPIEYIKKESMTCHLKNKVVLPGLVQRVIEYISKLDIEELETLSVESISMDFGINRTKLWRAFKKEKNMSPKKFLFRIKINQAAILLREKPKLTVKEIAEKTGFFCYGYFFHIFKKHFGTTPGKYRKVIRSQNEDRIKSRGATRQ
jgi:AraC-like DNA-binding protein